MGRDKRKRPTVRRTCRKQKRFNKRKGVRGRQEESVKLAEMEYKENRRMEGAKRVTAIAQSPQPDLSLQPECIQPVVSRGHTHAPPREISSI